MTPTAIVQHMLDQDAFSRWLGIKLIEAGFGESRIQMVVRDEMCNGHGTAHGGIVHSLADSAFAFACNSHGPKAVAAETSVSYLRPLHPGDALEAHAVEEHRGRKLGRYRVDITRNKELVARFFSTCYILDAHWEGA